MQSSFGFGAGTQQLAEIEELINRTGIN